MDDHKATPALNPYAPTTEISSEAKLPEEPFSVRRLTLRQTIRRWVIICTISAAPSFLWGFMITSGQVLGMMAGILTFIVLYTFADFRTAGTRFRQMKTVHRTLQIAYITRITISIIFPIAFYVDIACGLLVVSIMEGTGIGINGAPSGPTAGFFPTFFTTLLQGVALNVVLAGYAVLVHGIQWAVIGLSRLGRP